MMPEGGEFKNVPTIIVRFVTELDVTIALPAFCNVRDCHYDGTTFYLWAEIPIEPMGDPFDIVFTGIMTGDNVPVGAKHMSTAIVGEDEEIHVYMVAP